MDEGGQTRRQVLKGAIGAAAGIVLGAPVRSLAASAAQAIPAATQQLSDDLFVICLPARPTLWLTPALAVSCSLMAHQPKGRMR